MDDWDSEDHLNYDWFGVSPEDITDYEASEGEEWFPLDIQEEGFYLNW